VEFIKIITHANQHSAPSVFRFPAVIVRQQAAQRKGYIRNAHSGSNTGKSAPLGADFFSGIVAADRLADQQPPQRLAVEGNQRVKIALSRDGFGGRQKHEDAQNPQTEAP